MFERCGGYGFVWPRDAAEVVPLRDHLRPQQDPALGGGEAPEGLGELPGLGGDVRVEPEALQLRQPLRQLGLELLRAGPQARDLGAAAGRAELGCRLAAAAVVAVEPRVGMEGERDVAPGSGGSPQAGSAGRATAPAEEEDARPPSARARSAARRGADSGSLPRRRPTTAPAAGSPSSERAPLQATQSGRGSRCRTPPPLPRAQLVSRPRCERRSAGRTPACTPSRAPRRSR
jgi:hypothetical protein